MTDDQQHRSGFRDCYAVDAPSSGHLEGTVIEGGKIVFLGCWVPAGTDALKQIRELNATLAAAIRSGS